MSIDLVVDARSAAGLYAMLYERGGAAADVGSIRFVFGRDFPAPPAGFCWEARRFPNLEEVSAGVERGADDDGGAGADDDPADRRSGGTARCGCCGGGVPQSSSSGCNPSAGTTGRTNGSRGASRATDRSPPSGKSRSTTAPH